MKPSEKFKNTFNFSWDNSEDTSVDINPLYSHRLEPQLLFGRGHQAGVNIPEDACDRDRDRDRDRDSSNKVLQEESWKKKSLGEMTDRDWRIFRENHDIVVKGGKVPIPMRSWEESALPDFLVRAVDEAGYKNPTAIQIQGIPIGLERRDMIGLAPTGSGKSAAFLLPIISYLSQLPPVDPYSDKNGPYALVLAPARELANQIYEEFKRFAKGTKLRAACIVGGKSAEEQAMKLGTGIEVIIGTPGRIQDAVEQAFTILTTCHYIVLDEADKMITDGFEENLKYILDCMPASVRIGSEDRQRTTVMFSATMISSLEKLARKYLTNAAYISIGEPGAGKKEIEQKVEFVKDHQKKERLKSVLNRAKPPVMLFVNRKTEADFVCKLVDKLGYRVATLHGSKSQDAREKALEGFRSGRYDILVCTDVAGRGIDVEGVTLVINYDAPHTIDDYNHRIGRTGRAGSQGRAVTFLTASDEGLFYDLRQYLERTDQVVPAELADHQASKVKVAPYQREAVPRHKQLIYTD